MLSAKWGVNRKIKTAITTREGGYSLAPYDSFNLALHVGDNFRHVHKNRESLQKKIDCEHSPLWLNQTHSTIIDWINSNNDSVSTDSDACFTSLTNTPCVILTADCLPILLAQRNGEWVGAVHAGWRGLANGILEKSIQQTKTSAQDIVAWIGPSISQHFFEVSADVCIALQGTTESMFFIPSAHSGKYFVDLAGLAKRRLLDIGVHQCSLSNWCCYEDSKFYSYRRDTQVTGRTASLIWISA